MMSYEGWKVAFVQGNAMERPYRFEDIFDVKMDGPTLTIITVFGGLPRQTQWARQDDGLFWPLRDGDYTSCPLQVVPPGGRVETWAIEIALDMRKQQGRPRKVKTRS